MKKCVITFIFGQNKEKLREPLAIDSDIEYICVTDNDDIKSKTWKIIYDNVDEAICCRDKMAFTKYNPFKYTDAEYICVIDGALQIKSSLNELFSDAEKHDILLKKHPIRSSLYDELNAWVKLRGLDENVVKKFESISKIHGLLLNNIQVYETCVIVFNRSTCMNMCYDVIMYMKFLGDNGKLLITNQCVLSLLEGIHPMDIGLINQKKYFVRFNHNSDKKCDW